MADVLLIAIGLYILYKLIFDFIVPVYHTTARVKSQFRNMRGQSGQGDAQNHSSKTEPKKGEKAPVVGEYIDFEEIKK